MFESYNISQAPLLVVPLRQFLPMSRKTPGNSDVRRVTCPIIEIRRGLPAPAIMPNFIFIFAGRAAYVGLKITSTAHGDRDATSQAGPGGADTSVKK